MANNIDLSSGLNAGKAVTEIDQLLAKLKEMTTTVDTLNKSFTNNTKAEEAGTTATKKKKEALSALEKLEKTNLATLEKLNTGTSKQALALERSKQALASQNKARKEQVASEREAANAISQANNALKKEVTTVREAEKQNVKLRLAVKNSKTTTDEGRAAILRYNAAINKNTAYIDANSDRQKKGFQNVGQYAKGIKSAAGQMLGFSSAGAAAVLIVRKIATAFKEARADVVLFEKEFANVLTLLSEADKLKFKDQLESGAIAIMAKYGLTVEDTTKSLFDAISAGVEAGDAIEFLDNSARVATAGNAQLSSVVDGATTVLGAYGSKAGSTTDILNSFFAAQVKGKTTVGLLASNIGKVASTAAAADIPVTELMSTFAGLTKFIGGTEDSATALTNVINALIKPSDGAKATFKSLGIETGITAIKQNGLLESILKVADAYETDNDVLTELIPNIRAFKGIAGLTAEAVAELKQNTLDLNNSEASSLTVQNALTEQMNTRENQTRRLEAASKALNIERDKTNSVLKKIGTAFREARIERKLYLIQKNEEKQASQEFRSQVEAEIAAAKERGDGVMWYSEAARIVKERNAKAEADAAEAASAAEIKAAEEAASAKVKAEEDAAAAKAKETEISKGAALQAAQEKKQAEDDEFSNFVEKSNARLEKINENKQKEKDAEIKAQEEIQEYLDEIDKEKEEEELTEEDEYLESIDNKIKSEQEKADKLVEIEKEKNAEIKAAEEALAAEIVALKDEIKDKSIAAAEEILSNAYGSKIDDELARKQEQYDTEQTLLDDKLDKGVISEAEYAKQSAAIDLKSRQADAKAEKKKALFDIAIGALSASIQALPNVPKSLFALAAGAVAAGAVAARPIPQFFKGTDSAPAGLAIVGEKGAEAIEHNGNVMFTPSTATLMDLGSGGQRIINAEKTKAKYGNVDNSGVESRIDKLIAKPVSSINVTRDGIVRMTRVGNAKHTKIQRATR